MALFYGRDSWLCRVLFDQLAWYHPKFLSFVRHVINYLNTTSQPPHAYSTDGMMDRVLEKGGVHHMLQRDPLYFFSSVTPHRCPRRLNTLERVSAWFQYHCPPHHCFQLFVSSSACWRGQGTLWVSVLISLQPGKIEKCKEHLRQHVQAYCSHIVDMSNTACYLCKIGGDWAVNPIIFWWHDHQDLFWTQLIISTRPDWSAARIRSWVCV